MPSDQGDYSELDRPEILMFLFHPRPEWGSPGARQHVVDLMIPVDEDTAIGARFHAAAHDAPNLLFFHGNGEIVGDYDELGTVYTRLGINFFPADYRGYGRSTGSPSVTSMMADAHRILDFSTQWLKENGYWGPVFVMGRSLGSASAIELAAVHADRIAGLIVESGFADTAALLELLGIDVRGLGLHGQPLLRNVEQMSKIDAPTLIIHGENDHIIPHADGKALFDACPSPAKRMLTIPGADHNDLLARGFDDYMHAVRDLVMEQTG